MSNRADGLAMRGIEITPHGDVSELVKLGVDAERTGFDTVFVSCHYMNHDPFGILSLIADSTTRARVGPGVANPYQVHPVVLASRMATLDEISAGRSVLGLGAGDSSALANLGIAPDRPLERVLETLQGARRLWRGERLDANDTFDADGARLLTGERSVPIYLGAQGPDMLRMSAKYADGVLVNAAHPADFAWASDRIEEGLADRGTDDPFEVVAFTSVSVAADEDAARRTARDAVAYIIGGASDPVLDRHGIARDVAERIGDAVSLGDAETARGLLTDEMIDAFCIAGTPDRVSERLASISGDVDGIVVGTPLGPDDGEAVALLADAVDHL